MKLGHRHDRSGGLMDGVPTLGGTGRCDAVESVLIRNRARKFRLQTDWCWWEVGRDSKWKFRVKRPEHGRQIAWPETDPVCGELLICVENQ